MYKGKRIPSFWWDFRGDVLIIESNNDKYPVVTSLRLPNGNAEKEITVAEKIIADLKSGRLTMKEVANTDFNKTI